MRKDYLIILFAVIFASVGLTANAQIIANDDVIATPVNGVVGGLAKLPNGSFFSAYTNDSNNGSAPSFTTVTISQVSTTNAGVNMSSANVSVTAGTAPGTYVIVYQICQISNPSNCDTATVTVNVCSINAPIIAEPTCSSSSNSLFIQGLPAGSWTLYQTMNSSGNTTITGSGTTYTVTGLSPASYTYRVKDSSECMSGPTTVTLGYLDGINGTVARTYNDANNDGIINIGDNVLYSFSITNTLSCVMTNVQAEQTGTTVFGSGFSIAPGQTNTSMTAVYNLTQNDINQGAVWIWFAVTGDSNGFSNYAKVFTEVPLSISSGIKIISFFDTNANGIFDNTEQPFESGYFTYQINNTGQTHYIYSYSGEMILYETNPANTYDIGWHPDGVCQAQYSTPVTMFNDVNVPANSGITTYAFPITVVPCVDLTAYIHSVSQGPRPGQEYLEMITFTNYGNQPIASGTITFTKPAAVTIVDVSPSSAVLTPTGFTYTFTNLGPLETWSVIVTMAVPPLPTVTLGQQLTSSFVMSVPAGDSDLTNHDGSLTQTISGSYDPNDKRENHGGKILFSDFTPDDYLTYTIRFENTGTANAETVVLNDILDPQLNASTFRFISASHPMQLDRAGSNVSVLFSDIDLPPSEGEDSFIGKGFFTFSVKPNPGYEVGDIIYNTADIIFDTNPEIVTNTTSTEFVASLKLDEHDPSTFQVYPNPVSGVVNFASANAGIIDSIRLYDVTGKMIMSASPLSVNYSMDLTGAASGLYVAVISSGGMKQAVKVNKM